MSEWQTMETAPKDGTAILVWDENARRQGPCGAWAYSRTDATPSVIVAHWNGYGWASDLVEFERGWESTGSYTVDISLFPTHWMPLPPSPGGDHD